MTLLLLLEQTRTVSDFYFKSFLLGVTLDFEPACFLFRKYSTADLSCVELASLTSLKQKK